MCSIQKQHQRGFSLLEVSVALAIILLLAVVGIPSISHYLIESKVPKAGEALARFIVQAKINAQGAGAAPYRGVGTAFFANMVRDSGVFSVLGNGADTRVLHHLGDKGEIQVVDQLSGARLSITLTRVHEAACPSIASVMQRVAHAISLEVEGKPAFQVKAEGVPYNAIETRSRCGRGNSNTFVFVIS